MKDGIRANEAQAPGARGGPATEAPNPAGEPRAEAPAEIRDSTTHASAVTPDTWSRWRAATPARIALGRAGVGVPTDELLRFAWAHAMARDAIHVPLDEKALSQQLAQAGWEVLRVRSSAPDRTSYLQRPDLGRRLDPESAAAIEAQQDGSPADLCFVIGDGLSSLAIARHAVPLLEAVKPYLARLTSLADASAEPRAGMRLAPVVVATQARVALADEVGELCKARLVVMLVGERPGLSSPDSLGIYITYGPRLGRSDAERNCISNVRPEGLSYEAAAFKLMWLVREALQRGCTGIELKDESDIERLAASGGPLLGREGDEA